MRTSFALVLSLAVTGAFADQGHIGKYTGTMMGSGGRPVSLDVNLAEASGTWKMIGAGAGARQNPCLNKDLPLEVVSGPDPLVLQINGGQMIAGCMNQKVTLSPAGGGYKGATSDGREVNLSR